MGDVETSLELLSWGIGVWFFYVVIPYRYSSTRLPDNPFKLIPGKPMIQHIVERRNSSLLRIIGRVEDAVKGCGARVYI